MYLLEQLIKNKIDAQEYGKVFEEKEDLEYFLELIEILIQKRILVDSGDEEIVESYRDRISIVSQKSFFTCNIQQFNKQQKYISSIEDKIIIIVSHSNCFLDCVDYNIELSNKEVKAW